MDGVIEEIETSDARFATDGWGMWLLHAVGSLREAAPGGPIGTCGLDDVLCAAERYRVAGGDGRGGVHDRPVALETWACW